MKYILAILILAAIQSKNIHGMENSTLLQNPLSLIALSQEKIGSCFIDDSFDIELIDAFPETVALQIINDAPQGLDSFAHKFARKIEKDKGAGLSVIPAITKFEYILKFIRDFDKQGKDEQTLLHILAGINYCPEAVDLMFRLIFTYKACINVPAQSLNIMESAIFAQNKNAVKMLHETTQGICNLEHYRGLKCFVTMIENGADIEEHGFEGTGNFFGFVKKLLPSFRYLYTHRYVLAPCCQKGHAMFYDHTSLKRNYYGLRY